MNKEITQAIIELKQAEQNFKYAASEFIDVAIMQLFVAEMKVDTLLKLRKENGPTPMDPRVRERSLTKILELIVPQQMQTVKRKIKFNIGISKNISGKHVIAIGKNF
jgi:hypothetical protein